MGWWMDQMKRLMGHVSDATLIDLALDGLEGGERQRAEAHLRQCALCREALRRWMELHDAMAALTPSVAPSPGLEARILKAARNLSLKEDTP